MIDRFGLFRDPSQGRVAGVAAGLADRFSVSAGVIRLAFILLALCGTPVLAVVLYAVLAVLMPIRPYRLESSYYRGWRRGN